MSMHRVQVAVLGVWRLILILGVVLLAVLVATTLLQVLSRYVLRQPFDWTEEAARYIFVWVAMLGAGIAAKDRAHFFVDLLLERMPPKLAKYVTVFTGLVSSAFLLVISWAAVDLALSNGVQDSPVLTIPMSIPYFAIPVGLGLMALFAVSDTVQIIRGSRLRDRLGIDEVEEPPRTPAQR
jgi:TRAP-type C4-dicarboxylate transport system permease small subunit